MSEITQAVAERSINTEGGKKVSVDILMSADGQKQVLGVLGLCYLRDGKEQDVVLVLKSEFPNEHIKVGLELATTVLLGINALFSSRDYEADFYSLMKLEDYMKMAEEYTKQFNAMRVDVGTLIKEQKARVLKDFTENYVSNIELFKNDSSSLGDQMARLELDLKGNEEGLKFTESLWLANMVKDLTETRAVG